MTPSGRGMGVKVQKFFRPATGPRLDLHEFKDFL